MGDGFDAALDAAAFADFVAPDGLPDSWLDDQPPGSTLLRIERIEEVELPAATDDEARAALLAELDRLWEDFGAVDDVRAGESIEERNARLRRRDIATARRERPAGEERDPTPVAAESAKAAAREFARLERRRGAGLGADAAATRRFIRQHLAAAGVDVDACLRPPRRGRPTADGAAIRRALVPAVAAAKAAGATVEAIALATNRTGSSVVELLRSGGRA